jgi:hypothetical protein
MKLASRNRKVERLTIASTGGKTLHECPHPHGTRRPLLRYEMTAFEVRDDRFGVA